MFEKLGRFVAAHPWLILATWLLGGLVLLCVAPPWTERCLDDDLHQLPAHCESRIGYELLCDSFPREAFGSRAIFAFERSDQPLTESDFALVDRVSAAMETARRAAAVSGIGSIANHRDAVLGSRLVSPDRHCTLILVSLESPFLAFRTTERIGALERVLRPIVDEYRAGSGLRVVTTGTAGIGRDLNAAAYDSVENTTLATVGLVIVILLLIYRAPLLALVPLATIGGSVWLSLRLIALASLWPAFQVVNITSIFVVVVLYGAGTDYCMFLISRYREELRAGRSVPDALAAALGRVGGVLTASAATVVCGLGMMGFAEFAKLRCTGPAIALSLLVALLASLTFTPALLRVLGNRAFWPRVWNDRPIRRDVSARWTWLSRVLACYPVPIFTATVLLLAPLAVLGLLTRATSSIAAELPRQSQARAGLDVIRNHFTPGELGPLTVLLQGDRPWTDPANRELIQQMTDEIRRVGNVVEVRSICRPRGDVAVSASGASQVAAGLLLDSFASPRYLADVPSGHVTRLEVVFATEPFAPESAAAMEAVRDRLHGLLARYGHSQVRLAMFGITSVAADINRMQESDRHLVNGLVIASVLLILLVLVRRPVLAVYLLLSVLFSYFVALGAAEVCSLGWLDCELGVTDWKVPFFLFVILVAIGEDYNIFLIARVLEEARTRGLREGTLRALERTGGTITACGLIMAGTFATLMLGQLGTLVQLGLALTIGVLLDTFIVRPVLVPAFLLMVNRPPRVTDGRLDKPHAPGVPHLVGDEPAVEADGVRRRAA